MDLAKIKLIIFDLMILIGVINYTINKMKNNESETMISQSTA